MNRRDFITLLGGAAAWPLSAYAQAKLWRIGLLDTIPPAPNTSNLAALRKGLSDFGYVEGRNLAIEYRSSNGNDVRFDDFAAELLRLKVDLIVTRGTPALLAAKRATATIPVVMAAIGEPMLAVASIARPGGNVTGLSAFVTDLQAKRVELLKDMIPAIRRIGVLFNMGNPVMPPQWKEIETAAHALRLEPLLFDVRSGADIDKAFDAAASRHIDALVVSVESLTQANADHIAALAISHRLPTIYASREFVEVGGLLIST